MDLVSLRYPLVLASFAQACLVFFLLPRRRPLMALAASITVPALGVIQFLNPTAHWYCPLLLVGIVCALRWLPAERPGRLLVVGFLLGLLALFRQLSGVIAGLGVVAYLLIEAHGGARGREVLLQRLVVGIAAVGLGLYLLSATDVVGWLLFGVWPLLLLAWLGVKAATPNRQAARILLALGAGALIAALPLFLYHLAHGSLDTWRHDTFSAPFALGRLPFIRQSFYGSLTLSGLVQIFDGTLRGVLNGIYWLLLPLAAAINGLLTLRALVRQPSALTSQVLPVLAVFYGVISVHFQIPIYLHYTVGVSLVSLLGLAEGQRTRTRAILVGLTTLLVVTGLYFHGAQPVTRGLKGIVMGERVPLVPASLPRASLSITEADRNRYHQLVRLIEEQTQQDQTIFSFPGGAELYFLSGRRNPFRFWNTAFGVTTDAELLHVERVLREQPPALVFFDPRDKYSTRSSARLIQTVRTRYVLYRTLDGLEIYRPR